MNWLPIADTIISVAKAMSSQPVLIPTGDGPPLEVDRAWYVDDAALAQAGEGSLLALTKLTNCTGLMIYIWEVGTKSEKVLVVTIGLSRW